MKYFNLILVMICAHILTAQYSESENSVLFNYDIDYSVSLDTSITVNKDHVYTDYLSQQEESYIQWVYQLNEQRNTHIKSDDSKTRLISDRGVENSLIFTLKEDGELRYDTVSNLVEINIDEEPEKIGFFRRIWNRITMPNVSKIINEQQIEGSLPKGCMTWVNANSRRLKCGLEIVNPSSEVAIILLNMNGEEVHKFAEGTLYRGWNNYEWKRKQHNKGRYILSITVDEECMTQVVSIK